MRLASEVEGTNGTVAYTYDAIGRLLTRTVAGSAESWAYEPKTGQMRVQNHADGLGNFTLGYLDATDQLTSQSNGTVGTAWSYDTNANDRRLTNVATTSGTAYGLTTTADDEITGITDSWNNMASITNQYDRLERFITATGSGDGTYGNFSVTNDPAGNLTTITRPTSTVSMTPNTVNEIASANSKAFTYDADGDLLTDYGRTYKWDAANRMVSIAMGTSNPSVTFSYDGLGRRVKKTMTQPNGGGSATTSYLWCGQTLCMAQYGGGATRCYVAEGEVYTSGGTATPYYYGPDQLGSVRDVLNAATGALLAHYDYDTYGLGTGVAYGTVTGTSKLTDYGYVGMLYEPTSGISLANYRAYDPQTARWMSRDPIGEAGGINLYQYVLGDPISGLDPLGLCDNKCNNFWTRLAKSLVNAGNIASTDANELGVLAGVTAAAGAVPTPASPFFEGFAAGTGTAAATFKTSALVVNGLGYGIYGYETGNWNNGGSMVSNALAGQFVNQLGLPRAATGIYRNTLAQDIDNYLYNPSPDCPNL